MSFYFSELEYELRVVLNDTDSSAYRYTRSMFEQFARDAVREIHRVRPDAKIGEDSYDEFVDIYSYSESATPQYLGEYQRITGWDKVSYPVLYAHADASNGILFYPTSADRTSVTDALGSISGADLVGTKLIVEDNSSDFGGVVTVTYTPTALDDWNITASEAELPLDNSFREAAVYFILFKCFDIDSEDTGDSNLSAKYRSLFTQSLGM